MKKLIAAITGAISFISAASALALTAGQTYTISVEKVNSNGTVTSGSTSLGISTTATAESDGKVSFTFSSSIPTSSSTCNFLVVSITDSSGTVVRQALAPCPVSGSTVPLGVSGVTDKQVDAMLQAFQTAGTNDPIMAVFGFAIVRSGNMSSADLLAMADVCYQGLYNSGGFIDYLQTTRSVTTNQLETYRRNIVAQLGDSSSGYTKLMKDAVEAADSTSSASYRGKAAGVVLKTLVTAAEGVFPQDYIMEAFNAMGAIAVPLMQSKVSSNALSATGASMVNAGIGGGINKLRADRSIEKYTDAMTLMGASGADLTQFDAAVSALRTAMENAFAQFEDVFSEDDSGSNGDSTTIDNDNQAMQAQMQSAFSTYMSSMAVANARITSMISNIDTALGSSSGLSASMFKFYSSSGNQVNWPVNMVVLADWASSIRTAGGNLTYSRDSASIPSSMSWMGVCSNSSYYDRNSCQGASATWTAGRTCFGSSAASGENGTCLSLPTPYSNMLALQQDIMIREFTRFSAQDSAGNDMHAQEALEKAFTDSLRTLADTNLGGTTNGSTPISDDQKRAIVTLMQSPQF